MAKMSKQKHFPFFPCPTKEEKYQEQFLLPDLITRTPIYRGNDNNFPLSSRQLTIASRVCGSWSEEKTFGWFHNRFFK